MAFVAPLLILLLLVKQGQELSSGVVGDLYTTFVGTLSHVIVSRCYTHFPFVFQDRCRFC